jgi:aldehyde:ferredoxin oxidoreductase
MTGIKDLDLIAQLDYLCDSIGVDTMSCGVAIAVAMDSGYADFGDGQAAIGIMKEIERATKIGKVFGEGPLAVGKHFGNDRVPVAKGQSIAGYDPRGIQGMAVTYSTSPMGGDHTAGFVIAENLAPGSTLDPLKPEGQAEMSRNAQIRQAFMDCTGLCSFASSSVKKNRRAEEAVVNMINAKHGLDWTHDHIREVGLKVLKEEREFNRKAGFTKADDHLPDMFYSEPLPPHNKTVLIPREEMENLFDF